MQVVNIKVDISPSPSEYRRVSTVNKCFTPLAITSFRHARIDTCTNTTISGQTTC